MNRAATRQTNLRQWILALFVLVAGALFSLGATNAHAAPPAGTVIGNQATATYNDAGGTARVTTSNQVQTTVTQVKTFTLTANGARSASPGQTVYYPHTITNTGNGADTYTLNAPTSTNFAAAAAPHGSLAYYIDANGDGVPDNAAPINTSGAIAAGGIFRFVVAGTVPAAAANGNTADIVVSVSDTVVTTATNTDTTTVAASVITVTKALSPITGPSPNTGVPATVGAVMVTLSYNNSGSSAATNVELRDAIPAGMTYVAGTGRWSVSGATALADGAGGDPAGIGYDYNITSLGRVTAIIASVAAGASGTLTFQVNVNNGVVPGFINNTAQYLTSTQPITNTNTASYQVLQSAGVVANGSITSSINGIGEPVTVAAAAAGSTLSFTNVIWNLGNAAETFVISMAGQGAWPAGSTFTLLQSDGATTLIANTTPSIPLFSAGCAAGFEADVANQRCGYRVILRAQLPPSAAGGPYSITKTATSSFDNTRSDTVVDTLTSVTANTVDVTNNTARIDSNPPGTAAAGNAATTGFGATGTTVITTNNVTPAAGGPTITRFQLYVNNVGALSDSFNLSTAAVPAGWTVVFRDDGGAGNCTTVGATLTTTGVIVAGANRLVCAEATVPSMISAQAAPGTYNLDFTATSVTNAAVNEVKRDAVVIGTVSSVSLTPNNAQQTFAGSSLTYSHTILNSGNASETISFAPGFLTDTRATQGWASAAYIDGNSNGVFDPGVDDVPANLISTATTFALAVNASRAIFVRVVAPGSALVADPANVTTLIARYNAGASSTSATDTTTVASGLTLQKMQRTVNCDGTAPGVFSTAPIAAGPLTLAGRCLQYQVTGQNTSAANMTLVAINDNIPANTRQINTCGAPASTVGTIASPGPGNTGTISATVGTLTPSQSVVVTFCAQIDIAPAPGTIISNQASASGQAGPTPFTASSNTVNATVGGVAAGGFAAVLAATTAVDSQPGATVLIPHTLTNTGAFADTYTITVTDVNLGSWSFTSVTLFPDANGDGQPDSAVPLAMGQVLAPGQVLRFVARLVVPAGAPLKTRNDVRIAAASAGAAVIAAIIDRVSLLDPNVPRDCGLVTKMFSKEHGPSPAGPITVTLGYNSCDQVRSRLVIIDRLPAGMRYVAGSGRWTGTGATVLTDAVAGTDRQGSAPAQIAYDFNVTFAGAVTATVYSLPVQTNGYVTFDVEVDAGIAAGTTITNVATYRLFDSSGVQSSDSATNIATYIVTGRADFDLTGEKLPTAMPGATVSFTNVLNNRGDIADTYDITLAASTFPPGTTFALFRTDGVTPLSDTNGNGTPDTGVVAAGGSYRIVVRTQIPGNAPPAAYKVTKTARSGLMPSRTASADDSIDTLATRCEVTLEPDNNAQVGFGQHVTYTHYLTNRGNCPETVHAMLDYLGDSRPGWTSGAYIDNPVAGGGSLPGALDRTDTKVVQGWSVTLQPGESLRVLVDVLAPTREAAAALLKQKAKGAKASVDSNLTTLVITSAGSGALVVRDTTRLDDQDEPGQPDNAIRNFTDSGYSAPTFWGVIGGNLWLRADAASCNAAPDLVESRLVAITGPDGEREEITATETGPNTGIFLLPPLPIRSPPVVAGDRIVEGRANDVFDIEILGCGRRIATVVTLMQPVSVVFDSRTNDPVAGATVTLVSASGGQCSSTTAVGVSPNPVVTGDDGRFSFPPLAGASFCLSVKAPNGYSFRSKVPWPLLPQGRNLNVTGNLTGGSYGDPFPLPAGGLVVIDVPVDPAAQDGLFIQKDASRAVAELGDFIDYRVRVRNGTGNLLDRADVTLTDDLPAGFAFVPGSARLEGKPIADPLGGKGPRLTFALGHLDRGQQLMVTYRVRVGPGSMQGDGVNRVQARYVANGSSTLSNIATAKVLVTGGVFSDKGFILGKVFLDCNANSVQDKGEQGVPGVRLLLEDGTYIITDGGGKYSFYGISNRTHVVKADRTTLPAGARLATTGSRNLGDAGSRIVDLKAGEMQRADFAVAGCDADVVEEVRTRAAKVARSDELGALVGTQLATEPRVLTDVKTLPASGIVEIAAPNAMPGTAAIAPAAGVLGASFSAVLPPAPQSPPSPAPRLDAPGKKPSVVALEKLVPGLDDKLGFIGITDGQTMPFAQATIRVKGAADTAFKLAVNGVDVPEARVGKRAVLAEKRVQAWEYIGVDLKPGENTLSLTQLDSFGNARGSETIRVIAPDKLAKLVIELPASGGIADGKTSTLVVVKLTDSNAVPVTVRTAVTLEASRGRWQVEDLDLKEPGVQAFVENGRGEFALLPPLEPGESQIVITSGAFKAQARLDFLPELRKMIATGVIEGVVNLRNVNTRALTPARESDGFEQELNHLSREWNAGRTEAGARAAFYLKGKIKGEYLLTAAYDSDKDTKERLFRDIQPDEFYPIYGDSGVRGYDAQSTSRLYVRVDHRRSYLLWGDFNTNATSEVRKLTNYSRSLTGVKHHFENERVSVNAFASRDSTRQVIEELRANGTSGPFQLGTQGALVNSEKIEIITRDRNQPALIIAAVAQSRFADYEIEALTGRILFKAPVPSVDRDLNPVFVRVTYEVDQGGEQFWVAGVDAQVKVTDRIEVGAMYVKDKNPLLPFTLAGANLVVKLGAGTYVIGEVARAEHGVDDVKGDAGRIELKHESKDLRAQAFVARTDRGFDNPGSYLTLGRSEAGAKLEYKITPRTTVRGEALRTEDVVTGASRDGAAVSVQHQIADRLTFELGLRHAAEKGSVSPVPAVQGQPAPQPVPDEVTTVRARLTGSVPGVEGASVYGEVEVDVRDTDRRVLAAGGEYLLPNKSRLYARHEFISSITGPYGLNATERQNTTAVGIDTEYMKDGHLFSEYRIRDAMSGGDVEAALGLKNLWSIAPGLRLGTTFERVKALSGTGQNENTALALALEYTANPLWKGSTRLELRDAATQESVLFTVGLAARLNRDWTALARNAYTLTRNKTGGAEHLIDRMQAGLAWRDNETNKWNVLARVESRVESDDTQENMQLKSSTQIVSIHADWQPRRPFLLTGRYAAKWSQDKSSGLSTRYRAQVIGGRATWEFAPRWDVAFVSSALFGDSSASRQYGVGLELGYLLATNLWVSAGYNFFGYRDADLAGADYTSKGPYVRLRYKFDETLFDGASGADSKAMNKTVGEKAP